MLPRDHYLKQAFQDLVHFPNGFEKGGLSDIQARLVRKNGVLISALCVDEVSDPTTDDLHILKVIANQSAPKSPVEQAWVKYLSIVKNLEASAPSKGKAAKSKAVKTAEAPEPEPAPAKAAAEKPAKAAKAPSEPVAAPKPKAAAKAKAEPVIESKTTAKKETKKADTKATEATKPTKAKSKA